MSELIFNIYNILVVVIGGATSLWCYNEYKRTHSRPLLNCLPGVFTSLGLLGTFVSICWSLHGIGSVDLSFVDNTGKTLAEVKAAGNGQNLDIMKIISELIPAFTSSIAGLICALGVTIWTKIVFAKEEFEENEALQNKTPETYIQEIAQQSTIINEKLVELIQLQHDQEEKSREYNAKLNSNISNQSTILKNFIDGFVNRMDDIFKQMHGAIQSQVKTFGEEQFTKTSELLTTITQKLSNVSNEIINDQRESVKTMMNNTNEEVKTLTTAVTKVLDELTQNLQGSLTSIETAQTDRLKSIMENYDSLSTKLSEQNSSFATNVMVKMQSEYEQIQTHNAESLKQLQGSLTSIEAAQAERLNSIIANYDSLATKLSEQNSSFASKVTTEMQNEYQQIQTHNVESLKQMVDLKDAYQEATSDMLASTLDMNQKATTDLRESMSDFVIDIQKSISTQCETLKTAISSNVNELNKAYGYIGSLMAEIRQNYDQAVLAYGDVVNVAHRNNETSEKVIIETNNSLKNVEDTNKQIVKVLDILTERQENIDHLTKQISHVSATIVELQKLENTLNKLTNA